MGVSPNWTSCETTFEPMRAQQAHALVAKRRGLRLDALLLEFFQPVQHQAQHVGVKPAAQALVGRDDEQPTALTLVAFDPG